MSKCEARLPSTSLPEELYFCTVGDQSPSSVYVTTDNDKNVRIKALGGNSRPDSVDPILFSQAFALAQQNIPMVRIIKKNGVHQKAVYTCPVSVKKTKRSSREAPDDIVGVLIGVDYPAQDEKTVGDLITPPTPEDVDTPELERSMMSRLIGAV